MKLILLLHLTLSLQGDKTRKTKFIRDSAGHPKRKKKLNKLKKDDLNNIFRNRSRRTILFGLFPRVINSYGLITFDTLALWNTILFILKKSFLFLMLIICRVLVSLLNHDPNGN